LTTAQAAALSSTQIAVLTSKQVAAFETADLAALSTSQIAALSAKQTPQLSTAEIAALLPSQISAITTAAFAALSAAQIAAIETADVAAITTAQISALSCVAHRGFTQAQVAEFSTPQLNALNFATPLVLDLNGDGLSTLASSSGVVFDLLATGTPREIGWIHPNDGLLVLDLNKNGQIDDGKELFGAATELADGTRAVDGFAALAALDSNADGTIDKQDPLFDALRVWIDADSNAQSTPGELRSLAELGITRLYLKAESVEINNNGNMVGLLASYQTSDGQSHQLADVWLAIKPLTSADAIIESTAATEVLLVPALLPDPSILG
jgi:hypothetical protein